MSETTVEKRIMSPHNTNSERKDSAYKRSNKPFMEKKRRARINSCLTQLKTLVLQAMRKDSNQYSKLEKADILEMTVKHLRQLQRQQVSQAMSCDPTVMTKYKTGFNECANEVMRYLGSVPSVDGDVRGRLMNHLGNIVTQVNTSQPEHAQQQQPLNVQIPPQSQQATINQHGQIVQNGCLLMPANINTSPLVLHSVQNVTTSNAYTQPIQQRTHVHTSQQQQQQQQQQFSGSFQIVHNANTSPVSAVAVPVYLGQQAQNLPQSNVQTSPTTCSNSQQTTVASHYCRTPPRTKASLKAFDSSAFSQVSSASEHSNNSSPSCSPTSQEMTSYSSQMDLTLNGLAMKCGRTPSPLKVEDVWRPW